MTDNPTELCERLRRLAWGVDHGRDFFAAADLIEAQAARIQQQALEYTSLFDQCAAALDRMAELEKARIAEAQEYRGDLFEQTWTNREWGIEGIHEEATARRWFEKGYRQALERAVAAPSGNLDMIGEGE